MGYNKDRTNKTLFSISTSDVFLLSGKHTSMCFFQDLAFATKKTFILKKRPLLPPKIPQEEYKDKIYVHGCYQTMQRNYYHV